MTVEFGKLYAFRFFFLWPMRGQVGNVVSVDDELVMPVRWARWTDWNPETWLSPVELEKALLQYQFVIVLHRGCLRVARVDSLVDPNLLKRL